MQCNESLGAEHRKLGGDSSEAPITMSKRGSRVKAAVAAWNGQEKAIHYEAQNIKINAEAIDSAFEDLLVSHALPHRRISIDSQRIQETLIGNCGRR